MRIWLCIVSLACLLIIGGIRLLDVHVDPTAAEGNGRLVRMFVTGYTSCDYSIRIVKPCDGITASGRMVAPGTVACGPSYPFGTVFDIVGVGRMTCWDRGGGIRDHMLDVWFPDVPSAIRAGISAKWMEVIIYSTPPTNPPPPSSFQAASVNNNTTAASAANSAANPAAVARSGYSSLAPAAPQTKTTVAASQGQIGRNTLQPQPAAAVIQSVPVAQTNPAPHPVSAPAQKPAEVATAPGGRVIARLSTPAPHTELGESGLGNLVADMLRTQYGARVALVANRDLRVGLPAGVITDAQVREALAPGRKPLTEDLRGETLRRAIEHSLSQPEGWDGFLHVSGLQIGYNPDAPVGQRLTRFTLENGQPVADQQWYRVALTDGVYFADGYTAILEGGKGLFAYQPLEDMAITWLSQRVEARPGPDGRLKIIR